MKRLKEKVSVLQRSNHVFAEAAIEQQNTINNLTKENSRLFEQAKKIGPLITENVKLGNKLEDLQNQIDQMVEELS